MAKKFKDKKIIFLLYPLWGDGTSYKFVEFLKTEYGIETTVNPNILTKDGMDLGICLGDRISSYGNFLKRGISYLLVEHDVASLRYSINRKIQLYDRRKIENACAVIFTSEDHAEYYKNLGKKNGWHIPEYVVIHNKPLRKDIQFDKKKKLENLHLVYAGGLSGEKSNTVYNYRSYHFIFGEFIKAGWKVHIYPTKYGRGQVLRSYARIGCTVHSWIPGDKIFQEMSQYTAGFHGYNKIGTPDRAYAYTQLCRPNKLWDYLAAGIPTIGYQGGNGMEIYQDKWGIIIDDLKSETLKAIPERLKKIKILQKWREKNVLEKDRDKFEYIIGIALKNGKTKKYISPAPVSGDRKAFPKTITIFNKSNITIYRENYAFIPNKETEPFQVNESTFRLLKAHVHLRITIKE